jgi:hypothetical protein
MDPPDPPLTDGVVWLRPADERDAHAIERGITDPEVVRWFGQPTTSARDVLELNRARWLDGSGPTFASSIDTAGSTWSSIDGEMRPSRLDVRRQTMSIPPGSLDTGVLSYAHPACQDLTSP